MKPVSALILREASSLPTSFPPRCPHPQTWPAWTGTFLLIPYSLVKCVILLPHPHILPVPQAWHTHIPQKPSPSPAECSQPHTLYPPPLESKRLVPLLCAFLRTQHSWWAQAWIRPFTHLIPTQSSWDPMRPDPMRPILQMRKLSLREIEWLIRKWLLLPFHGPASWNALVAYSLFSWHGNPLQYSSLEQPQGQRSLWGYNRWSYKEPDTTARLSTHVNCIWVLSCFHCFSLSL